MDLKCRFMLYNLKFNMKGKVQFPRLKLTLLMIYIVLGNFSVGTSYKSVLLKVIAITLY